MRRRRALWATALLFLLPIGGETWWRLTEPSDRVDTIGLLNAEEISVGRLLLDPAWRRRVGYTPVQAAESRRRVVRRGFLFAASTKTPLALFPPCLPERFEFKQERLLIDGLWEGILMIVGEQAALTVDQRRVLRSEAARREGPFLMTDPGIGAVVGLTRAQQNDVWDRDIELRRHARFVHEDDDEWIMRFEGAPATAIEAHRELFGLDESSDDSEDDASLKRHAARLRELSSRSSYSPSYVAPRWLRERRRSLTYRRLWADRREAEARLLASLSPGQRARWNALVRG